MADSTTPSPGRRAAALVAVLLLVAGGAMAATALAQDNDTNDTLDNETNETDGLDDTTDDNLTVDDEDENVTDDDGLFGDDAEDEDEQEVQVVEVEDVELVNSTFDNDTQTLTFTMDVFLEVDELEAGELNETEIGENLTQSPGLENITLGETTIVDVGVDNDTGEAVVRIQVTLESVDVASIPEGGPSFDVPVGPPGEPGERGQGQGGGQDDGEEPEPVLGNDTDDGEGNLTDEGNETEAEA